MAQPDPQMNTGPALLETKLFRPEWRNRLVARDRLVARLSQGEGTKLTLVSAQAGFGKSTLLAEWLAKSEQAASNVGWVSLDHSDSDPGRFWAYAVTAIQRALPGAGEKTLALLGSQKGSQKPPTGEQVVASLINEVTAALSSGTNGKSLTLVLDDYHLVESEQVHSAVSYLLDHMPPGMRLVIASRAEPPLPLPRLRARGELTELRADDLRFTSAEAAEFLRRSTGIDLRESDIRALEQRTEGWVGEALLAGIAAAGAVGVVSMTLALFTLKLRTRKS